MKREEEEKQEKQEKQEKEETPTSSTMMYSHLIFRKYFLSRIANSYVVNKTLKLPAAISFSRIRFRAFLSPS